MNIFKNIINFFKKEKNKASFKVVIPKSYIHEEAKNEDRVFGASKTKLSIVRPNGQWIEFVRSIDDETQRQNSFDPFGCVSYSLLNIIEIQIKAKYGCKENFNDRFTVVDSGTTSRGNNFSNVISSVRKSGVPKEGEYQYSKAISHEDYFKQIPYNIYKLAKRYFNSYLAPEHDYVYPNQNTMIEALKYSPLWVGGFAWHFNGRFYVSSGRANHAFVIVGYEKGVCWYAYDSYAPYIKRLSWNYKFAAVKTITINKAEKRNKYQELMDNGTLFIMRADNHGELYRINDDGLIHLKTIDDIKKELKDTLKVNDEITRLAKNRTILPLSEADYKELVR